MIQTNTSTSKSPHQHPAPKDLLEIFDVTPEQSYKFKRRYWQGELEREEYRFQVLLKEPEMEVIELPDTPPLGALAGWLYDRFYNGIADKHNNKRLICSKKINKLRSLLANKWNTAPKEIDIDRIKTDVSLVELMAQNGHHALAKTTRSTMYLCPFHDEKTPSFHVFKDNKFHCFGCQADGSNIDYVMRSDNLSFAQAINSLKDYL